MRTIYNTTFIIEEPIEQEWIAFIQTHCPLYVTTVYATMSFSRKYPSTSRKAKLTRSK